jgi:hypothetical protein
MLSLAQQRLSRTGSTQLSPQRVSRWPATGPIDRPPAKILAFQQALGNQAVQAKLAVSRPGDPLEHEADRVAEAVLRSPVTQRPSVSGHTNSAMVQRACANCDEEEEVVQAKASSSSSLASAQVVQPDALPDGGAPLPESARSFFEPRFGRDFGKVRIHTDGAAAASAHAIDARAFTVREHIFFRPGAFAPSSQGGRRLLAHELAHTLQQTPDSPAIQRDSEAAAPAAGPAKDPLCASFDFGATQRLVSAQATAYQASKDTAQRLMLIRTLKLIWRCASPAQQAEIQSDLAAALSPTDAAAIWKEAGTPLGGYTGMYPGFASDIKRRLEKLGIGEALSFGRFELSASGATHRSRAKAVAAREVPELARTDILYFRGHQFAQYRAPGVFSDGSETYGFDLRYIEKVGGFPNVKLIISTSCATLCKEAFDVFHSLFPNAVILGYRKSAPLEGGKVRDTLESKVTALGRPLLLEESVDVASIISAWRSTIEERHAKQAAPVPGYYDGSTIHYWDGAAWKTINPTDAANKCYRKGDFRGQYPAPT